MMTWMSDYCQNSYRQKFHTDRFFMPGTIIYFALFAKCVFSETVANYFGAKYVEISQSQHSVNCEAIFHVNVKNFYSAIVFGIQ